MSIKTRFAPSPTGLLHVGNVRTALINWLFTKKNNGKFILRIDDTDLERSTKEFEDILKKDLDWLGLEWDSTFNQKDRLDRYEEVKTKLIADGRLYPCYETKEELDFKRKIQLSQKKPPIYDRAALKITSDEIKKYESEGRKPHFRFKLNDKTTSWQDMIRGDVKFEPNTASDPILIRENGSWTYMLCSAVDDIDFDITHIIRGEDHISNTAINIQILEALGTTPPTFAHVSRVTSRISEMSKRSGGFDIKSLREQGIEPMTIVNFLATLGTSKAPSKFTNIEDIVSDFDMNNFNKSPTIYDEEDLISLNHKILSNMTFADINPKMGELNFDEDFWLKVRNNINKFSELEIWYNICKNPVKPEISEDDKDFLLESSELLSNHKDFDENTWDKWIAEVKEKTSRKGKNLFMPVRLALTGLQHGPELKFLLPLITKEKSIKRLAGETV
ncbi:MAG: glutamate--tRNA ligase [Alphaproteobacteria bacterium]|nr:glutamate--tRNA ligase [Alphaproteobacteria bacterium]